ncbi:MAG: tetratricopeptide repeat protein [Polyangiaceae bacterium]|nr:tetratricopeptide repeat protein [Polyangiaceae bacterium]
MTIKRRASGLLLAGALAVLATVPARPAAALEPDEAVASAQQQIQAVNAGIANIQAAVKKAKQQERSAEQRIGDAVLAMGSKDYARAANLLNEVIEKYPNHPTAYPDALNMLGEVYFRSKQYLSARRVFKQIVDRGTESRFSQYQATALGRLVDIALRLKELNELDAIFASIAKVPSGAASSALSYARGKGLFAKRDFAGAKAALAQVDAQSEYTHQSRYIGALIAMKEATPPQKPLAEGETPPPVPPSRYAATIDLFLKVTQLQPDTAEHRRVIDMSWLAIGRLLYETDQYQQAVNAYNHIDRSSTEFGTMLYELAWVYVKLGDIDRAQRALEVLAIADPNSTNIADGSLLRGDLMLRGGQFEASLKVYESVRNRYDPMREKVEAFLASTNDPAVYYDRLSQTELAALDNRGDLPAIAVQWAREEEDGPLAFAVIDDVAECRDLIKRSNELIERLNAVLNAPNRVRAFPELKAGEEQALQLLNRVSMARLTIGQAMDAANGDALSGDIGGWRAKRRALQKRLSQLPVTDGDFQEREGQAMKQWNTVSQALQRLNLQVDTLQATINGLRRVLREGSQSGVVRDPASVARFEQELAQNEHDLALYRQQMDALRKMVSAGKLQVGFGDQRFIEDSEARKAYREALTREVELAAAGQGGTALADLAKKSLVFIKQAAEMDDKLESSYADLEREVQKRAQELTDIVTRETRNMVNYSVRLDALDKEARGVVGEVAKRNFGLVRDRLRNIVLRADVGVTEEAWEVREEQMTRVRSLKSERSREKKLLDEELNEVLDDSGDSEDEEKKQ